MSAGPTPERGDKRRMRTIRILLCSWLPPWPVIAGGHQRTNLLFRALSELGSVDLITTGWNPGVDEPVLRRDFSLVHGAAELPRGSHLPWRLFRSLHPGRVDRIAGFLGRQSLHFRPPATDARRMAEIISGGGYDVVVCRFLRSAVSAMPFGAAPVLLDMDDRPEENAERLLADGTLSLPKRMEAWRTATQLRSISARFLPRFAHIWVVKPEDAEGLPAHTWSLLRNIPYCTPQAAPPQSDGAVVLLVGFFGHPPNLHGADWFVGGPWPKIRAAFPSARLRVVGGGAPEDAQRRWRAIAGVEVGGFVADLAGEYAASAFTVAPLFRGAGTSVKVAESIAYGRAVVATQCGARGYADFSREGQAVLVAEPENFHDACLSLLRDGEARDRRAASGAKLVREVFSQDYFNRVVAEGVERSLHRAHGSG